VTEDELEWIKRQLRQEATKDEVLREAAQSLARISVEISDLLSEATVLGHHAGDDVVAAIQAVEKQVHVTLRTAAELLAWFE
jgi:uncharacterized protein YoxC